MRFEELLYKAMSEDEEVVKAVWRFYRGSFDRVVTPNLFGERFVLFDVPAYSFEDVIRDDMDSFVDGIRAHFCGIHSYGVAVITPCHFMQDSNYTYRLTTPDNERYFNLSWDTVAGDTIVPKKELVKVLKKRGWM